MKTRPTLFLFGTLFIVSWVIWFGCYPLQIIHCEKAAGIASFTTVLFAALFGIVVLENLRRTYELRYAERGKVFREQYENKDRRVLELSMLSIIGTQKSFDSLEVSPVCAIALLKQLEPYGGYHTRRFLENYAAWIVVRISSARSYRDMQKVCAKFEIEDPPAGTNTVRYDVIDQMTIIQEKVILSYGTDMKNLFVKSVTKMSQQDQALIQEEVEKFHRTNIFYRLNFSDFFKKVQTS